jgi:hypothetical protein
VERRGEPDLFLEVGRLLGRQELALGRQGRAPGKLVASVELERRIGHSFANVPSGMRSMNTSATRVNLPSRRSS